MSFSNQVKRDRDQFLPRERGDRHGQTKKPRYFDDNLKFTGDQKVERFSEWKYHFTKRESGRKYSEDFLLEEYRSYIQKIVDKQDSLFFQQHHEHDFFRKRYEFNTLLVEREKRIQFVQNAAKELFNSISLETVSGIFPTLDCPEDLQKAIFAKEKEISSEINLVGERFDRTLILYCHHISPKVSDTEFKNNLFQYVSDLEKPKGTEEYFEVYFSNPAVTAQSIESGEYFRSAWIFCKSKEVLEKLVSFTELDFKLYPQRRLPNRLAYRSFSNPKRFSADSLKAFELASNLDRQENIDPSFSISALINTPVVKNHIDSKADKEKARLDIFLIYLKTVHLVCFYSGTQFRDLGDMFNDSFLPRLRQTGGGGEDEAVLKDVDAKLEDLLRSCSEEEISKREERRKKDEALYEEIKNKHLKRFVEENSAIDPANNKFVCKISPEKLFRGEKFLLNHMLTKHPEELSVVEKTGEIEMMKELFLRDVARPTKSVEYYLEQGLQQPQVNQQYYQNNHSRRNVDEVKVVVIKNDAQQPLERTLVDYSDL